MVTMKRLVGVLCTTFLALGCQTGLRSSFPTTPTTVSNPAPGPQPNPSPSPIAGTTITPGQSITDKIAIEAPHCFEQWDATARCRQFDLATPSVGILTARLIWTRLPDEWDPELFLVRPDGRRVWAPDGPAPKSATISVEAGTIYRIVILSYRSSAQHFKLSTELQ
jgi:hypothetical protein